MSFLSLERIEIIEKESEEMMIEYIMLVQIMDYRFVIEYMSLVWFLKNGSLGITHIGKAHM